MALVLVHGSLAFLTTTSLATQSVTTTAAARQQRSWITTTRNLAGRDDDNDDERYQAALAHNKRRTDVRIFLTQRALQSFIDLLIGLRHPHTVRWLEEQLDFSNLESYHGTGGLDLTRFADWDSLLLDLLQRPNDVVIVAARRRGRGHGGWSSNNPHLEDRFVEFEIDIEPASLVTRLLSVRQQIANEWIDDLNTLVAVNELILGSYHELQNQSRNDEQQEDSLDTAKNNDNDDVNVAGERVNIEDLTTPYSDTLSRQQQQQQPFAYERKATVFLNNKIEEEWERGGMPSSSLRKGSFDLLSLLATQEAIHTVLRQYMEQREERHVSFKWLRDFYTNRLEEYFDGHGKFGRCDDFLQELLLTPPTVVTDDNTMELVDPLRIAEDLIQARSIVALEWKDIMKHLVPSDHMELQKDILAVRMGQSPPERSQPTTASESSSTGGVDIFGEFE